MPDRRLPVARLAVPAALGLGLGLLSGCSSSGSADVDETATARLDASGVAVDDRSADASDAAEAEANADAEAERSRGAEAAPPRLRAWMDQLTVRHHYDPATGFIVADEVVALPPVLRRAPDARTLVAFGAENDVPVVVFATADRCAPCQQYKKDALNDPEVLILLESGAIFATHVEVDREPELAREVLGSLGIPMTYLFRNGEIVGRLSGQRSAAELRTFLREAAG
jgi:hypothetical protein